MQIVYQKVGQQDLCKLWIRLHQKSQKKYGLEDIDLKEPKTNIAIGTKYFGSLLKYYDENYLLTITAYNAGIGTVKRWIDNGIIEKSGENIENVPYKETNNYVRKILKNYRVYKELYV